MNISVRDIQKDKIKQLGKGELEIVVDYVTHKVLIMNTSLSSFTPPQVCKITHKLRQICGYGIYIIPRDIQTNLNGFRTRLVTDLNQKSVFRHTNNSLCITTSAAHYKDKVFPDDQCLHANIKYADQCINFIHIRPKNMIHVKSGLVFSDEYPEYNITNE